jgi:hypothetical protein
VFARVAAFEGSDPSRIDEVIEGVRNEIESGMQSPPAGLEGARGTWMLVDRKTGKSLGITLFDSEDDMQRGDAALDAMSPALPDASGRRTSVEFYEVALRHER